ncbi:phosphoglycerate dehydrogenase [Actinocorallia longicatena]|uniref:D-3-phosphoglycerate dehydrogenase n=1 Tax=Actinocorallia longicatena TaxID=111803 RepID=A0ABP6Q2K2_9ACTN
MSKPVVLVAEELSPAGIAVLENDFEVRYVDGADRAALLPAVAEVDALIIRSATKANAEVFEHAKKLRVVARAGVGLDNVDVEAATKAGVMVVNAPTSNIVTAAEHAIALLMATARNVPQGHAALKQGEWKRSKYTGVELQGKTVGVLGLGRIGVLVAQRLAGFDMEIVAYDPYIQAARAAQLGVKLLPLDELLQVSDFVTVHLPKTKETLGLIGDRELHLVKPEVRIINAARGGIVDENALDIALKEGRVAGAGLDVFSTEPCTDSPLFLHDNVVATPHLGASTHEAQEKAGTQVAQSVKLALSGEFVPDAVNVQGGAVAEDVKPGLPLTEKLGRIFTSLAGSVPVRLDVIVRGEITAHDVKILELAALKGVFADVVEESVTFVNAPLLAGERGIEVSLSTSEDSPNWRNVITVKGTMADGEIVSVSGTLSGPRHLERIVEINGFDVELSPAPHMAILGYIDRPGVIGTIGKQFGDLGINIAGMQVGRDEKGGKALTVLTVDSSIDQGVLETIAGEIGAGLARRIELTD